MDKITLKTFSLLLVAIFALFLVTSCGNNNQKNKKIIGISIPSADHGWTGGVVWWAQQAKKKLEAENKDLTVIISTAKDAAEQVDKIENLLVRKISALVVLPHEPAPLTGICQSVKAKNVKLLVVDRNLEKDIQDLTIAGDNTGFGKVAAQEIAKELKGKGNILIMEGIPCAVNNDRVNGFKQVIKNYPNIKILDSQSADWNPEKGLKLMENFLQKHKAIDAVWAGDDDVLVGALQAYKESKRNDVKLFVGGGGSKVIIKRILDKDPVVKLTVTYPPKMVYVAAQKALEMLNGKTFNEKVVVVPAEAVTSQNAKDFYFPDSAY